MILVAIRRGIGALSVSFAIFHFANVMGSIGPGEGAMPITVFIPPLASVVVPILVPHRR